jgi:hypothetical protein
MCIAQPQMNPKELSVQFTLAPQRPKWELLEIFKEQDANVAVAYRSCQLQEKSLPEKRLNRTQKGNPAEAVTDSGINYSIVIIWKNTQTILI